MTLLTVAEPLLVASTLGLCIGFLMAITGAGGAILALPLLTLLLHLTMQQAAPIALMAVFAVSSIAAVIGLKQGRVRYKAAALLAATGVAAAPLGVSLAIKTPAIILHGLFIVVLSYVAWRVLRNNLLSDEMCTLTQAPCEINPATSKLFWTAGCTRRMLITGGTAGFLSGLLGVGGGFIVVPSLQKISNLEHRMIVATTLTMIALVSLVSVLTYASHAEIIWQIALPFMLASIAGSLAGRSISNKISQHVKQIIFGSMALVIALMMLVRLLLALH